MVIHWQTLFTLLGSLTLVFILAACGTGAPTAPAATTAPATAVVAAPTTEPTAAPTDAPTEEPTAAPTDAPAAAAPETEPIGEPVADVAQQPAIEAAPVQLIAEPTTPPVAAAAQLALEATPLPVEPTAVPVIVEPTAVPVIVEPTLLKRGFFGAGTDGYAAVGSASLVQQPDGSVTLQLSGFQTQWGPDLFVYLSGSGYPLSGADIQAGGAIEVTRLSSHTNPEQTYSLAPGDYSGFNSVVIWCRAFDHVFSAATLQ